MLIKAPLLGAGQLVSGKQLRWEMCQPPFIKRLLCAEECDKHFVCILLFILLLCRFRYHCCVSRPAFCRCWKWDSGRLITPFFPLSLQVASGRRDCKVHLAAKPEFSARSYAASLGLGGSSHGLAQPKPLPLSYIWIFNGDCPLRSILAIWADG